MTTQASDLTALFNDSMDKLTSKQDTALAEVDSAKQAAITAIEEFQNVDTSNWQKFKLTKDDGAAKDLKGVDWADPAQLEEIDAGFYYATTGTNIPVGASSYNAFITVIERSDGTIKRIEFRPYDSNQLFIKRFYKEWEDWEPAEGTLVELYDGNVSGVDSAFTLNDDPNKYAYLMIYGTNGDGSYISPAYVDSNGTFFVKDMSIFAGADGAMMYETECQQGDTPTDYSILNSLFYRIHTDEAAESVTAAITKIVGVK